MFKCLVFFVFMSFVLLLVVCVSYLLELQVVKELIVVKSSIDVECDVIVWQDVEDEGVDNLLVGMFVLVFSIFECVFELIGMLYCFGGMMVKGFDCSGFVGYLFCEEVGIKLLCFICEFIDMDVLLVFKDELQFGDLLFFNNCGCGCVSYVGIYIGDGQFIYFVSCCGGGVWVDSLDFSYWSLSYMEVKWVFEFGYKDVLMSKC